MDNTSNGSLAISGIHHITLEVWDLDEAMNFYTEILGLDEITAPENIKAAGVRWLKFNDDTSLHLILKENCVVPQVAHMALRVENVYAWKEYLVNKGESYQE